jgi:hypothetical protein
MISSRNYIWFTKKNKGILIRKEKRKIKEYGITTFDIEKEKTAHTFVTWNEYHAH